MVRSMILNDLKFLLFKTKNKHVRKFNIFFDSLNISMDFRPLHFIQNLQNYFKYVKI
jgi:hypothetical protein